VSGNPARHAGSEAFRPPRRRQRRDRDVHGRRSVIRAAALVSGVALPLVLALAPPSETVGAPRHPFGLSAAPARVMLTGRSSTAVRVTNTGTERVRVDVSRAGFALDLRGRPRIIRRGGSRSAARWLTLRPGRFELAPRASAALFVTSKPPRLTEPGDHDALVLLSARPRADARVTVRLRLGVVVLVRAAGRLVRRLELARLRLARRAGARVLDVVVVNRGNVTESLRRPRAVVVPARGGRPLASIVGANREVRPRTRGIVEFPLRPASTASWPYVSSSRPSPGDPC
jgi:hypothetical protein